MGDVNAASRAWTVGPFREGDEREILPLFHAGFGGDRSLGTWLWRFRDNPLGGPLAAVARSRADGRVVGAYMCLPCHLDVGGERVPAAQVVDLVVHPDYRKQGMFEAMARFSYGMLASLGVRAQVAFPNPDAMSYPGFTRTLGWKPACLLRRFSVRLDFERPLARVLGPGPLARMANSALRAAGARLLAGGPGDAGAAGLEFGESSRAPGDCDELWAASRAPGGISFWKDGGYLRWRYDANPQHEFSYAFLRRSGRLVALAVRLEQDGAVTLCELLVAGQDAALGRALVGRLRRDAFRLGRRSLGYYGNATPFLASALQGLAPARRHENVLVVHAHDDDALAARLAGGGRWSLSYGDPDFA